MGEVDTVDMMISLHPISFRSKNCYMRIIWRIFDLIVLNSWILMNYLSHDRRESEDPGNWRNFRVFNFNCQIISAQSPQFNIHIRLQHYQEQ
jgi:hypothetical protein